MVTQPPEDLDIRTGILKMMERHGIPLTRENYVNLLFGGSPPKDLSPEEESDLPEEFRRKD